MGLIDAAQARAIRSAVAGFGLPCEPPAGISADAMRHAFGMDKKVADGRVRFVLATSIGSVDVRDNVPAALLDQTLNTDFLCEFHG
jgi:3-dehydroquinate synthase